MLPTVPSFGDLTCPLPLRLHQREALAAVTAARTGGSTRWWVTMPPGAGKTLVGTEVARTLGMRTVVLSPNTAIQGQWTRAWDAYDGPRSGTRRELRAAFTALTYQSLAVFEAGDDDGAESHTDRLHPNGRALIETMRDAGPLLVVLDECHHLLEVWGELLREVLDSLPDAVVLGLTATPPASLTRSQAALTSTLFGPVLYEARIPALVKEGTLAPYAELAWLVGPTPEEEAWLEEQSTRFAELTSDLFAPGFGSTPLPQWLATRFSQPVHDGTATWAEIATREPELSDAALRLVHDDLMELPPGAILHEQHRRPPTAQDWCRLLDDWLLQGILPRSRGGDDVAERDEAVLQTVRRTLPAIGYVWTKTGIRAGRGTVDRVTARSAAKQEAVTRILAAEHADLGERARVLVLCDHERATATSRHRIVDGATPAPSPAGSATGVLVALLADPACAVLEPLLVTGRTVAGAEGTLLDLVDWIDRTHPGMAASLAVDSTGEVPVLTGRWTSGQWVAHVTSFFAAGGTRALVGTRGLLGEGWDAPAVTTLVDLTTATTPTAVVQTRGRALRVDPAHPDKVALVWSVVCISHAHVAGSGDWERFARKHQGYFTVDEHGAVVDGVSGVDSSFSGYHPPRAADFAAIDARMLVWAEDRAGVREGWLDGTAYVDRVQHLVRIRSDPASRVPAPERPSATSATGTDGLVAWTEQARRRPDGWQAAVPLALLVPVVGLAVLAGWAWSLLAVPLLVLAAALWGRSAVRAAAEHETTLGLVAASVADGLHGAALSPHGADRVRVEVTPDGTRSFSLTDVEEDVSARFATALEEAVAPMSGPRYVVPRHVTAPPHGFDGLRRGLRAVRRHRPEDEVWHTVPSVLAANRTRADAYADAWDHWVGGGRPVLVSSPEGAGVLATHRGEDPFSVTCVIRRVWH